MDLAELTNQPIAIVVAGKTLLFSELTFEDLGKLQAWIKATYPHPLEAIRSQLAGFSAEDRDRLLDAARRDAQTWPPAVGSKEAARLLFTRPAGMLFTLELGLKKHQPTATTADAKWLLKRLNRDEAAARKIVATLFGDDDVEDEGVPALPKDPGGASPGSTTP